MFLTFQILSLQKDDSEIPNLWRQQRDLSQFRGLRVGSGTIPIIVKKSL